MFNNNVDNLDCCYSSLQKDNTAIWDLKNNKVTIGTANLNSKQINDISFVLVHDLLEFARSGGDLTNLSAKKIYSFLTDKSKAINNN